MDVEKKSPMTPAQKARTLFAVLFNIVVSISIILVNKWVYTVVGFPNMTLTLLHFLSTFGCLQVCRWLNMFTPKRAPIEHMIPVALCFCGFVVITNLSLEHNSVGTYQVAKVLTTPSVMFIQLYYGNRTNLATGLTVVSVYIM